MSRFWKKKDKSKDDNDLYLGDEEDCDAEIRPTSGKPGTRSMSSFHTSNSSQQSFHAPSFHGPSPQQQQQQHQQQQPQQPQQPQQQYPAQQQFQQQHGFRHEYPGPGNFGPNEGHGYGPGHSPYGQYSGGDSEEPHPIDSMPELAFENLSSKLSGSGRTMSLTSAGAAPGLTMVLNHTDTSPIIPTLRHPSQSEAGLAGSAYRKQVAAQRQKLQQQRAYQDIGSYPQQSSYMQQLPPPKQRSGPQKYPMGPAGVIPPGSDFYMPHRASGAALNGPPLGPMPGPGVPGMGPGRAMSLGSGAMQAAQHFGPGPGPGFGPGRTMSGLSMHSMGSMGSGPRRSNGSYGQLSPMGGPMGAPMNNMNGYFPGGGYGPGQGPGYGPGPSQAYGPNQNFGPGQGQPQGYGLGPGGQGYGLGPGQAPQGYGLGVGQGQGQGPSLAPNQGSNQGPSQGPNQEPIQGTNQGPNQGPAPYEESNAAPSAVEANEPTLQTAPYPSGNHPNAVKRSSPAVGSKEDMSFEEAEEEADDSFKHKYESQYARKHDEKEKRADEKKPEEPSFSFQQLPDIDQASLHVPGITSQVPTPTATEFSNSISEEIHSSTAANTLSQYPDGDSEDIPPIKVNPNDSTEISVSPTVSHSTPTQEHPGQHQPDFSLESSRCDESDHGSPISASQQESVESPSSKYSEARQNSGFVKMHSSKPSLAKIVSEHLNPEPTGSMTVEKEQQQTEQQQQVQEPENTHPVFTDSNEKFHDDQSLGKNLAVPVEESLDKLTLDDADADAGVSSVPTIPTPVVPVSDTFETMEHSEPVDSSGPSDLSLEPPAELNFSESAPRERTSWASKSHRLSSSPETTPRHQASASPSSGKREIRNFSSPRKEEAVVTIAKDVAEVEQLRSELTILTGELADSLHREYVLEGRLYNKRRVESEEMPENKTIETGKRLVELEKQLILERQKRHLVEAHFRGVPDYTPLYNENEYAEKSRQLISARMEVERLAKEIEELHVKNEKQQNEISALNSQLPDLRDLEAVHNMVGSPIELQKQIDELKAEKISLSRILEESSTRGPMGEKLRAVESQRDAFREALRSLRERKDAESRSYSDRIRVLEQRLEKEKLFNSKMTRHLTESQSNNPITSAARLNSPTALTFESSL